MVRFTILALAFAAAPALASSHYRAQPAASPAADKLVLRDTIWKCDESGCIGTKSSSRPAIVCAVLAKHVGKLRNFSADGQSLSAEDLEKCNARAH
jgi:hypothetical protein